MALFSMIFVLSAAQSMATAPAEVMTESETNVAAMSYMRDTGVSLETAKQRLQIESELPPYISELRERYRDRVAFISVESQPDQHLVVGLKGMKMQQSQRINVGASMIRVEFEEGYPYTDAEFNGIMKTATHVYSAVSIPRRCMDTCHMRFCLVMGLPAVFLSALSCTPVLAAEPDIFGIKLGAPLALPVCQISLPSPPARPRNTGLGSRAFNKLMAPPPEPAKAIPPATGLCVAPGTTKMAVGNTEFGPGEYGYLVFAQAEYPAWIAPVGLSIGAGAGDAFSLEGAGGLFLLRDGRVIALRFNTTGFEAQQRVMELLKRKFGPPDSQEAIAWNNDLGGSRESIAAQWRKPGFFADYSSVVQMQGMQAQGLSGGTGFLSIGNDLGWRTLKPTSKEADF